MKNLVANEQLTLDSREVAEMVGKPHNDLIKSVRNSAEYLAEGNFSLSEFFIKSSYQDCTGRTLPCYLITRKGCEFIAHKMTGRKGSLFTAEYINRFHEMEDRQRHSRVDVARHHGFVRCIQEHSKVLPQKVCFRYRLPHLVGCRFGAIKT